MFNVWFLTHNVSTGSKEIDQNKLATVYYVIKCLHNYLSISVKRLKVLPSLVTFPKNISSGLTQ